jgi:uncharacterized protein (DUF433 family)
MKRIRTFGRSLGDLAIIDEQSLCEDYDERGFLYSDYSFPEISPFRSLFEICRVEHPSISIEPSVLGGIPHIIGTRLSVGQILGRLYVLGSISSVAQYYAPHISEEQIKEAIAYAQDFLELAGVPSQAYD